MVEIIETALYYGTVVFHILIWWFVIGPILLVAPAFQISYLGVSIQYAETWKEKLLYHSFRALMWFFVAVWVVGLISIVLYHGGFFKWLFP